MGQIAILIDQVHHTNGPVASTRQGQIVQCSGTSKRLKFVEIKIHRYFVNQVHGSISFIECQPRTPEHAGHALVRPSRPRQFLQCKFRLLPPFSLSIPLYRTSPTFVPFKLQHVSVNPSLHGPLSLLSRRSNSCTSLTVT
jgi:hypothetical protein